MNDDSCACHLTQKLISLTLFISVNFIKLITRDTFSRLYLINLITSPFIDQIKIYLLLKTNVHTLLLRYGLIIQFQNLNLDIFIMYCYCSFLSYHHCYRSFKFLFGFWLVHIISHLLNLYQSILATFAEWVYFLWQSFHVKSVSKSSYPRKWGI